MKNLFTCLLLFLTITLTAQDANRYKENIDGLLQALRIDRLNFALYQSGQKVGPGVYLCKVNGRSKQVIFRSTGN